MDVVHLTKAAAIMLLAAIVFAAVIQPAILDSSADNDIVRHWFKSRGECGNASDANWTTSSCLIYKPLLGILGIPFNSSMEDFTVYAFIIIGLITPLLLLYLTKNWISVLFYFTVTNYFYINMEGIYAQALVFAFALAIITKKHWSIDILLVVLMNFTHGFGLQLGLIFFVIKYLKPITNAMLSCSGTFGESAPKFFSETAVNLSTGAGAFNYGSLIYIFTKVFPFPFMAIAVWQNLQDNRKDLVLYLLVGLFAGFVLQQRAFSLVPLIGIIGLTSFYSKAGSKGKLALFSVAVILGVYNLWSYIGLKTCLDLIKGLLI